MLFFFKHKTAYEMRISDWSSDVCSSDLAAKQTHLMHKDVELAVKLVLDQISNALARDERVEIRGFGSFALHHRPARVGRNPKTGEPVQIRSEEHTSELQVTNAQLVCRLLLEKKKQPVTNLNT